MAIATERAASAMPRRGERIDRFVVSSHLPQGRHATVLQARDIDGSFVAVKVATTRVGAELAAREERLLRTVDASSGPLPHLVGGASAGNLRYCATSWIPGEHVRVVAAEFRTEGRLYDALRLCRSLARAYAALHAREIVHGQVHPRHVLADGDGTVSVLDYSLAAAPTDAPPAMYLAARFNSLSAPEQANSLLLGEDLSLTATAEQYALGALIYLLLTGRMYAPLRLERRTLAEDILASSPLPFADHGVPAWPELEAILARALHKDPSRRYGSVDAFSRALEALAPTDEDRRRLPAVASVQAVQAPLARALEEFRRDAASAEAINGLPAPTCSINFGAAGVAYALTRLGKTAGDLTAFEHAERWLEHAEHNAVRADAFDDGDELTPETVGRISPFHSASGLAAVRAILSEATGDHARQQTALADFCATTEGPCSNLDLTLGRSSVLLVGALLYAVARRDWPATQTLRCYCDELCTGIWRDLADTTMAYHGIAHGWAGVAYATLMWARARDVEPPPAVRGVLDMLVAVAEPHGRGVRWPLTPLDGPGGPAYWPGWCHGNAGYVFLWNLAAGTYHEHVFAEMAERAAWLVGDSAGVSSLCCGTAGQAYAALNHARFTGEDRWRSLAVAIANRAASDSVLAGDATTPLSLYKGHAGLALLAVELECPDRAAMPLFEFEPVI